ncbi:MAG TPA: GNVR domain-containing protein [Limnobacter sp.]|uniref:GNVR domain-containing protein n=1 Tax=Limnobacter sp. TaxID=2003368 RepID=UPI002ED8A6E2
MTLNQLILIVRARLRLVVTVLLTITLAAVITAAFLPKLYTAQAKLVVDVRSADSVLGAPGLPFTSPAYMNTQAELITSARVVDLAIKQLKLKDNAELHTQWERSGSGRVDFDTWLTDYLISKVQVTSGKESNTLTISASLGDPALSAKLANGLARAYIQTAVELNVEPAKEYVQVFDQQLQEARDALITAQTRLSNFQRDNGLVVVSDERMDVETSRLNELSSALTQAQSQRADQASRAASSGNDALLQDPTNVIVINSLRTQLKQKQADLAEASARIGENHPEYARLKAEVDALQRSVQEEATRNNATLNATTRASLGREATIKRAVEEQRNKILQLKAQRDAAMTLQRDVDAAQKQFELLSTRIGQSEISSRQTTVHANLISEAITPTEPSSPRWGVVLVGALLMGLLMGVGTAYVFEVSAPYVRSIEDLQHIDLPPLGFITQEPLLISTSPTATTAYGRLKYRMRQTLLS